MKKIILKILKCIEGFIGFKIMILEVRVGMETDKLIEREKRKLNENLEKLREAEEDLRRMAIYAKCQYDKLTETQKKFIQNYFPEVYKTMVSNLEIPN